MLSLTKYFLYSGVDKTMEFLAQIGYFGEPNRQACSLYGLVLMVVSVWLAINTQKPEKED